MKEKRPYETRNIRILIRILYGIAAVIAMLTGVAIAFSGCAENVYGVVNDKMIIGFTITILSPFLLQVLYRLTLAPFDIIDLLREGKNLNNDEAGLARVADDNKPRS